MPSKKTTTKKTPAKKAKKEPSFDILHTKILLQTPDKKLAYYQAPFLITLILGILLPWLVILVLFLALFRLVHIGIKHTK